MVSKDFRVAAILARLLFDPANQQCMCDFLARFYPFRVASKLNLFIVVMIGTDAVFVIRVMLTSVCTRTRAELGPASIYFFD